MKRQVKKGFLGIFIAVATTSIALFSSGCKMNVDEWFCDHKYNDGIVIVDAGCVTDGALERTCTECGKKKKTPIIAVGHELDEGVTVVEPSCTVMGVKEYTCKNCHEVTTKLLPMTAHKKISFAGTPATCTETGMTEGYKCSECNTVLIAQSVIPPNGHKTIIDPIVYPTCTETGLTKGSHCEWCGEVFEKQEIMEALSHNVVTVEGCEPTCQQTGLTNGSKCDRCNTVYVEQEVIEALEHIDSDNDDVCDRCFSGMLPCDHEYGESVVVREASCSAEGQSIKTCILCGETETGVLEKLLHIERYLDGVSPTCDKEGYEGGMVCTRCGETLYGREKIPALGHNLVNNVCDRCGFKVQLMSCSFTATGDRSIRLINKRKKRLCP